MNRAILVKTCQRFRKRREACERTWVPDIRNSLVPVRFAEGGHRCYATTLRGVVDCIDGVIEIDGYDSYADNSIKLKAALSYLLSPKPTHWSHLFICDDDTFIHPQRWLAHAPQGELEGRIHRANFKAHGITQWIHGGSGFWMSRRLCELYVEHCKERTSADDVLVAKVAQEHGIEMWDRPDLYGGDRYSGHDPPERVSADNKLITCHHVQPEEMVRLWEAMK